MKQIILIVLMFTGLQVANGQYTLTKEEIKELAKQDRETKKKLKGLFPDAFKTIKGLKFEKDGVFLKKDWIIRESQLDSTNAVVLNDSLFTFRIDEIMHMTDTDGLIWVRELVLIIEPKE